MARDIGIDVRPPEGECDDPNCPFHGHLKVRGIVLQGVVVRARAEKTVIVEVRRLKKDPKYERYARVSSRIPAHNPPCIGAREGDLVRIAETRPISKTKHFVVIEVLKRGVGR
ncbi:MAG: 30S ribosomal protein S17 [Thermoplasmata archaeon]|nr:30S ribosomal protein S17 [Thermoplasmata archaeon]RLF29823.1 MAG: 30S ribosomal protein S17 [Thermoplasmata archaeon]HDJ26789.1 30S ribosomal protein S17 [Aciduliprofundum sp.]